MSQSVPNISMLPGAGFSFALERREVNVSRPLNGLRRPKRAVADLLTLLETPADSPHFVHLPGLQFERDGDTYELPRYRFVGPRGGDDAIRIGVFATIHGDEPESGLGLVRFLQELNQNPDAARGFIIHAYPICNPTGYEAGTRAARGGTDLNREFWRDSREPEVRLLERELQ